MVDRIDASPRHRHPSDTGWILFDPLMSVEGDASLLAQAMNQFPLAGVNGFHLIEP